MSTQAPQLDKGEMAAAERANLRLSEQMMILMVKALRNYAKHYPSKLQQTLSDPKAETKIDISVGNEKLLSATLGADNKVKETRTNTITDAQAQKLQSALSKQQGEMLDTAGIRDMRVLVNGVPLFEAKDGKVILNDLPPEFQKAIAQMVKPTPMQVSLSINPPNQANPEQQSSPTGTNSSSNATPANSPKQATLEQQSSPARNNPIPDVALPGSNPPTLGQEQLNRALITEAKKSLDRLGSEQSAGNRQWKHEKYTVTQKDGVTSVYVAETNTTIRQEGNEIAGNARQKDVEALSTVNASIDKELGKPVTKQIEAEL